MIEVDVTAARADLAAALLDCPLDPEAELEDFLRDAGRRFGAFPAPAREAIATFAADRDLDGALVVRGLPVDPVLPPTPTGAGLSPTKNTRVNELCLFAVASALGHPVGYRNERQGAVLHQVHPTRANEARLSSDSSKSTLGFHTEMAFHSLLPDYVLLIGLRQDPEKQVETGFAGVRRVLPRLTDEARAVLWTEPVEVAIEYSYSAAAGQDAPLKTVLHGDSADPFFRFDGDLLTPLSAEMRRALDQVAESVAAVRGSVRIEPGMLVAFDNRRCVHSRSSFSAHYDGRDRWLQRTVARKALPDRADADPSAPFVVTRFK